MNPVELQKRGIRIQRVVQKKGDIVASFIGTAHLVINTELNVAEAINFADEDWFSFGLKNLYKDLFQQMFTRL